jgi:hypothetical protein
MFRSFPSVRRLKALTVALALGLLVLLAGCNHDHHSCSACTSCVSDSGQYQQFDKTAYEPAPAPEVLPYSPTLPTYQAAQPVPSEGLRGPHSQAELDALFGQNQLLPLPPMPPRNVAPPPAPQNPGLPDVAVNALGEPGWNVPLAREWHAIVIHHSASVSGSAAAFDAAHKARGWDGLGYHFVIGNGSGSGDGQVEVGYRWTRQLAGAHDGNFEYNQHGVGICLVGDFEHNGPPSPRQMAALQRLVIFLQAKTGVQTASIIGHGNVPGRNTECPGRFFDMSGFRASLNSAYRRTAAAPGANKAGVVSAVAVATKPEKNAVVKTVAAP